MKFTDNTAQAKTQRTITKDGFLVVPATISKVGVFDYLESELGLKGGGIKKVARTEKSLFSDETIKSFENATLTVGHPKDGVNAKNWKDLSVGVVRNVKRVGDELTAEAWIYDEQAIKTVQEHGVEQLSCGYDCNIIPSSVKDADFEMSPMIGNHVAIVAKGRCGGTVKLADEEKTVMGKTAKLLDAFLGAFGIKLSDEQKKQIEEDEETGKDGEEAKKAEKPTEPKEKQSEPEDKKDEEVNKEEFEKQLKAKDAEIQALKDAQEKRDAELAQAAMLADAQSVFKDVKFADNASVREIQESVIVAQGIFTKDEAAKLSDAEISGAYQVAKMVTAKLADERKSLGNILLGDAKTETTPKLDFNKTYNQ